MIVKKYKFEDKDIHMIKEIYHSVGWLNHDEARIRKVFNASTHVVFALEGPSIVGFSRALSDGVFNAAIYDVVVHKDYQNRGVARIVVKELLEQLEEISCIHLISTTGNEDFYRKFGFKKLKTGMATYTRTELATEYLE